MEAQFGRDTVSPSPVLGVVFLGCLECEYGSATSHCRKLNDCVRVSSMAVRLR